MAAAPEGYSCQEPSTFMSLYNRKKIDISKLTEGTNDVFKRCFAYIEEKGMKTEGLYAPSEEKHRIRDFIAAIKTKPTADIDSLNVSPKIVISGLKILYRDVRPRVIPFDKMDEVVRIAGIPNSNATKNWSGDSPRTKEMKMFLAQLPSENYTALKNLFQHLYKMAIYAALTNFNSAALAPCWTPVIFHFRQTLSRKAKLQSIESLVKEMIDECATFFPSAPTIGAFDFDL